MKTFFDNIRSIIALTVVVCSFTFLFLVTHTKIPAENLPVLNTSTGLILAALSGVVGYYFGSSKNESDKAKVDATVEISSTTTLTTTRAY